MDRQASRRHAASLRVLAERYREERLTLTDPLFNLREILKQMLLLEDHLLHPDKQCPDCIHKHILMVEALGDEGVTLDEPNGVYTDAMLGVAENARRWMETFHKQTQSMAELAQEVRRLRKILTPVACDPRTTINRIASVYLARQTPHSH